MTTILGITGSLRRASTNTGLLRALAEMAPAHVKMDIADLHGIPMFNEDDEAATGKPESVKALDARIVGAGGGQFVGTARAQYHFRQNLQALQAITMPRPEVFVNHNEEKFDAQGNLTDAETRRYLAKWLESFLEWVETRP